MWYVWGEQTKLNYFIGGHAMPEWITKCAHCGKSREVSADSETDARMKMRKLHIDEVADRDCMRGTITVTRASPPAKQSALSHT